MELTKQIVRVGNSAGVILPMVVGVTYCTIQIRKKLDERMDRHQNTQNQGLEATL